MRYRVTFLPEDSSSTLNQNTVNLKSASFVIITLLHHSWKRLRLSFTWRTFPTRCLVHDPEISSREKQNQQQHQFHHQKMGLRCCLMVWQALWDSLPVADVHVLRLNTHILLVSELSNDLFHFMTAKRRRSQGHLFGLNGPLLLDWVTQAKAQENDVTARTECVGERESRSIPKLCEEAYRAARPRCIVLFAYCCQDTWNMEKSRLWDTWD